MPNHVSHVVTVTGPVEAIAAFKEKMIVEKTRERGLSKEMVTDTIFDFEALIPMPEILVGSVEGSTSKDGLIIAGKSELVDKMASDFDRRFAPHGTVAKHLSYPWVQAEGVTDEAGLIELLKKRAIAFGGEENLAKTLAAGEQAAAAYEQTGYRSWYPWAIDNWGTKWGAYSFELTLDVPGSLGFSFQTAWSTPEPIWNKIAETFPSLTFHVMGFDEGHGFGIEGVIAEGVNGVEEREPSANLYLAVYGEPMPDDEDEDEE